MAKSEFTEMQFVLGFVSEFMSNLNVRTGQRPLFILPSPQIEKSIGVDMMIEHFDHMEFHQYKRSEFLDTFNTSEYKKGLPRNIKPYYRFSLYDEIPSQQFTRLRMLADMHPAHRVYYVAPKFHTLDEFQTYFWNNLIMDNSIFVNCTGFNSARIRRYLNNNSGNHVLVFDNNQRYLFSEGIDMNDYSKRQEYEELTLGGGKESFIQVLNETFHSLLDDEPEWFLKEHKNILENLENQFNWVRNKLLVKYNINMVPIFNK